MPWRTSSPARALKSKSRQRDHGRLPLGYWFSATYLFSERQAPPDALG